MGKRYYCAYCDRSFKDDTEARKKHLSSLQHAKNRADHYKMYKDPEILLREECSKTPCKRYLTTGDCAFGLGCRFSHYMPSMMWELQRLVDAKKQSRLHYAPENGWPNPDDIIKEYFETNANSTSTDEPNYPTWYRPVEMHDYAMLPLSLWPITPESLANTSSFREWGQQS
ncbi:zinc finger matrin-type protein 5 [Hylaeus anthracinus]|uniref:zinc finger matrin-type protein 5 n=1 Tax=Hylaeus anthracinus TaxID=313031 RepID=UPI0023B92D43|nr:zinc finger matrin-type protein 5 [Hylaeus anthracinus]